MSTNLEYRTRETQRKRESRRQASVAQREKGRQRFSARDKKQRRHFFVGRTAWKFCNGGGKMRNASGHQCKVKMSGSKKKWKKKRVTKKFLEVSPVVVVQNNSKEMYKTVCCACKVPFLLIRPIVLFHCSPALPSPLEITWFYFLFEQTINIIESFLLALAKSIYYFSL